MGNNGKFELVALDSRRDVSRRQSGKRLAVLKAENTFETLAREWCERTIPPLGTCSSEGFILNEENVGAVPERLELLRPFQHDQN